MNHKFTLFFSLLFFSFSGFAQSGPIGFATLNGGTTGGEGGTFVTPANRDQFKTYCNSNETYIINVVDTIELVLYERIDVMSNKTILGIGDDATLRFGGLEIKGDNVIVQNVRITDSYDGDWDGKTHSTDAITIYGRNVWIDHCDLSASADGLLDVRSNNGVAADYITISNVRFSNHNKVSLFGGSNDEIAMRDHALTTIYNCWFDGYPERGLNQRNPRVRFADVHIFNCFYNDVDSYCAAARFESDLVVEKNFFRSSLNPHAIEDVGLGEKDPELVAIDNIYDNSFGDMDTSGNAFDPSAFYTYSPLDPEVLPAMVMNEAGLFNDPDNVDPVAVNDTVMREEGAPPIFDIDVLTNDTDVDSDDLRIADILNSPAGDPRIDDNMILYFPASPPVSADTVVYQMLDTEGGLDTAMIVITFEGVTSTRDLEIVNESLGIFPNPANDRVIVDFQPEGTAEVYIRIFDLNGQTVLEREEDSNYIGRHDRISLQTGHLQNGTYILQLIQGRRMASGKLTIAR